MEDFHIFNVLFFVATLLISIDEALSLSINENVNKFPAYSLQNMPKTDFTCRDKILGGYYADAETQCQMFHVCVKVAGVGVQDFRFLCPNGTAFDQEAQTCADWGDVDCEQATLYYGSDNFDLYRIGSGLESKRAPFAEEEEAIFHLQRAESNDVRRSKESIVNQSNSIDKQVSFKQQHLTEDASIRPSKQYQLQKQVTVLPRPNSTEAKPASTTQTYINSRPTPVLPQQRILSKQSNFHTSNDEIFKGSHSSNFYSNRNSQNDYDEDFRRVVSPTTKTRQRNRGRAQYRGTPSTSITTTPRPYSTYPTRLAFNPSTTNARPTYTSSTALPILSSSTALPYFTTKSTVSTPFKYSLSPTLNHSNLPTSIAGSQLNNFNHNNNNFNVDKNKNEPKLFIGPLQQQYQQTIYNKNNFNNNFGPLSSTLAPIIIPANYSPKIFNSGSSTTSTSFIPQPIPSVPSPFNTYKNNNNNNQRQTNNNLINNYFANNDFTNNNNNQFNGAIKNKENNVNGNLKNERFFDNNNPINNYQTTSPFNNRQVFYNQNQPFPNNNKIINNTNKIAVQQNQQLNQFSQPQKQIGFNQQSFNNNGTFHQSQYFQPILFDQRVSSSTPRTSAQSITPQTQIQRKPFNEEPPNFKHQDFINRYNNDQQRIAQHQNQFSTTENSRRSDQQQHSRFNSLNQAEQQKRLHYDINDYLTTSHVQNQYSPTSEQYLSVQTYPTTTTIQSIPYQHFDQSFKGSTENAKHLDNFTQKYNAPYAPLITTTANSKQLYEPYKHYQDQLRQQTQQQQTTSRSFNNSNQQFNQSQPLHQVPPIRQSSSSAPQPPSAVISKSNENRVVQSSPKKFSTLVPKQYYAPTTFKPHLYFNVAKHINDNLSTPLKYYSETSSSSTTTTARTVSITSPQKRILSHSSNINVQKHDSVARPSTSQPPRSIVLDEIDEDDGQYHPELYEQDFARNKLKNKKKQQEKQSQLPELNINNNGFSLFNNKNSNFNNRNDYHSNPNPVGNFPYSNEDEVLNTAHSQNIAASGNELRSENAKRGGNAKPTNIQAPNGRNSVVPITNVQTPARPLSNAPTISPNATSTKKPLASRSEKDASYDYAYYDSGFNAAHREYPDYEISDFGKTKKL